MWAVWLEEPRMILIIVSHDEDFRTDEENKDDEDE